MSIHKYFLILLAFCLPLTITACGGDDDDSLGGGQSQQDGDQGTQYATVASEKANLELYGEFDADKTKEVGGDTPALLLDDSGIEYSALGMSLPEQQAAARSVQANAGEQDAFASRAQSTLDSLKTLLADDGASVTELVNRMSTGLLGRVSVVVLNAEYSSTTTSGSAIRNKMIQELGSDAQVADLPQTGAQALSQFRVALAIVETGTQPLIWAAAFPADRASDVTSVYGDLNNGSAVVTYGTQETLRNNQQAFTQNEDTSAGVDILWVIDNSGSMMEEQQNLADGVDQFFGQLNNACVDFRLAATTTDAATCEQLRTSPSDQTSTFIDPTTADGKKQWSDSDGIARPGTGGSSMEAGFFCADKVDTSGFDRADADDVVVFVSDEPENETAGQVDPSFQPGYTIRDFNTYKQSFVATGATYFAIVGEHEQVRATFNDSYGDPVLSSCTGDGGQAGGGSHYREIAAETGGSSSSICSDSSDWAVMYNEIIETATGLASNFTLDHQALPPSVEVAINGNTVTRDISHQNGFDVIRVSGNTALAFYGDAVPEAGDTIEVSYVYKPASP